MGTNYNRKQYSKEYRRYVAELIIDEGRRPADLERELGISYSSLMRWVKAYKEEERKLLEEDSLETRLRYKAKLEASEKKLRELKEEREILRKALGFFSEDSKK